MKRKLIELLIIFFFYVFQITLGRVLAIGGIKPNLLIILPVIFGFLYGRNDGMFTGFFSGMMFDLQSSVLFGFSALVFTYIGYAAGMFNKDFNKNSYAIPITVLLIGDFVYGFASYIGIFLLHNKLDVMFYLKRFIVPEMLYTLLIMIVLYRVIALKAFKQFSRKG